VPELCVVHVDRNRPRIQRVHPGEIPTDADGGTTVRFGSTPDCRTTSLISGEWNTSVRPVVRKEHMDFLAEFLILGCAHETGVWHGLEDM
jgi:hypothetical protein